MVTLALGLLFASPAMAFSEPLLGAIELPVVAEQLRDDGVPDAEVRAALVAARETKLSAGEAGQALKVADVAVRKHGPLAAFGEFLKKQLHLGKRGKALESAIREEHQAKGTGGRAEKKVRSHKAKSKATVVPADAVETDPKAKKREERRIRKEQRAQERRERREQKALAGKGAPKLPKIGAPRIGPKASDAREGRKARRNP